jgi:hypothetical protein
MQHIQFFLGPAWSGAPPHYHSHAWNSLAYGAPRTWHTHATNTKKATRQLPFI